MNFLKTKLNKRYVALVAAIVVIAASCIGFSSTAASASDNPESSDTTITASGGDESLTQKTQSGSDQDSDKQAPNKEDKGQEGGKPHDDSISPLPKEMRGGSGPEDKPGDQKSSEHQDQTKPEGNSPSKEQGKPQGNTKPEDKPTCIAIAEAKRQGLSTYEFSYDKKTQVGTLTLTIGGKLPLCKENGANLSVGVGSFTYNKDAKVYEDGGAAYPQTSNGKANQGVVSKPGTYAFHAKGCQVDAYYAYGPITIPKTLNKSDTWEQFVWDIATPKGHVDAEKYSFPPYGHVTQDKCKCEEETPPTTKPAPTTTVPPTTTSTTPTTTPKPTTTTSTTKVPPAPTTTTSTSTTSTTAAPVVQQTTTTTSSTVAPAAPVVNHHNDIVVIQQPLDGTDFVETASPPAPQVATIQLAHTGAPTYLKPLAIIAATLMGLGIALYFLGLLPLTSLFNAGLSKAKQLLTRTKA